VHERLRSGRSRAPPVRRTYLDKADGRQRPIGIPAFEDKLVQRAVVMRWGAIDAPDCGECAHGFREGHSPHQALHELREQGMELDIGWLVEAEGRAGFDSLDHELGRERLQPRIAAGRISGLIGTWLTAGVVEGDTLSYPERGRPQGGVVSPLLAKLFRHEGLDAWCEREVEPRMNGRCFLIRCADDFVIGGEREADARRMMAVLPKRCPRFGRTMHPPKTGRVDFRKPARRGEAGMGNGTFALLGFTQYWTHSRRGDWVIKRVTAKQRRRRAMKAVWQWCRNHRHDPLREQHRKRSRRLRGHDQYYGIRGNYGKREALYEWADKAWRYGLSRRSQQSAIPGAKCYRLRTRYPLPQPRIVHRL
jgi:RNA-directed DNA polymerase